MPPARLGLTVLFATFLAAGCNPTPPTTDESDAEVFAAVLGAASGETSPAGPVALHPYLAIATDSTGALTGDLAKLAYEPSNPLRLLAAEDTTVKLCKPVVRGMCGGPHLVLSQVTPVSRRDVVVVVYSVRPPRMQRLLVRLRFSRSGWVVSGVEHIDGDGRSGTPGAPPV